MTNMREALIAEWDGTAPLTLEQSVMVCPQCEGEGGYPDGLDDAACHTDCTRCGTNGWIVDAASLSAVHGGQTQPLTLDDIRDWANATFGVPTLERCIDRTRDEWCELAIAWLNRDERAMAEEAADVLITLCNSPEIVAAAKRKMAVNRARKWTVHGDGTGQHVKEGE